MTVGAPDFCKRVIYAVVHEGIPTTIETSLGFWKGREKTYEDANFTAAQSPRVLDVRGDLGRNAHDGYVTTDGDGDLFVSVSDDGTNWGDESRVKKDEVLVLTGLDINKIRLRVTENSAYRLKVI